MNTTVETNQEESNLREIFNCTSEPVLTAVEVAERLGVSQQAAHAKLSKANEAGWVHRKKVGSRAVVWWIADQSADSA